MPNLSSVDFLLMAVTLPDDGENGILFTSVFRMLTTAKTTSTEFSSITKNPDSIVIIDSLTQLANSCLSYITRTSKHKPKHKPKPRLPRAKVVPMQMFPATSATKDLTE